MFTLSSRQLMLGLFITCAAMMAMGFYLEFVENLEPCPLCMSQRLFFVLCGVFGLLACLHNPAALGLRLYSTLIALSAVAGGALAGRHLWLQGLPPGEAPACGPSLEYMFNTFPFTEALEILLMGDGNCAEVSWTMLGITIPGWALIAFAGIFLFAAFCLVRAQRLAASRS